MKEFEQLPQSSLVPFKAYRLAQPQSVWVNECFSPALDPLQYAFCTPIDNEPASLLIEDSKDFFAERYGGTGLGKHGGGGRCGVSGNIQVKGIGRTPLLGPVIDDEHSYGGASLQEGVREALWSEVCNIALPYGAVRTLGVVATGTFVPNFAPELLERKAPRVIILREAALRPAHFISAPYFKPQCTLACTDLVRTSAAMQVLPGILRTMFLTDNGCCSSPQDIGDSLRTIFRRFAAQQAAAQVKRIIHGALSASNIALDGRWLDFGTIGMAHDYGRAVVSSQADAWLQFSMLQQPIRQLIFSVVKFLPCDSTIGINLSDSLRVYFETYSARLHVEFAKLVGIPEHALTKINPDILNRFCNSVQKIICRGNRFCFNLYEIDAPKQSGRFHLNSIIKEISVSDTPEKAEIRLKYLLTDEKLRCEIIMSQFEMRAAYSASVYGTSNLDHPHVTLNSIRVNIAPGPLCRPALDDAIERLVADRGSVMQFVASRVRLAKTFLEDPKHNKITVDGMLGVSSVLNPLIDLNPDGDLLARDVLNRINKNALTNHFDEMFSREELAK